MPYTPITIDVRSMPSKKIILKKADLNAGCTSAAGPVSIPTNTARMNASKLNSSPSGSPTKVELMNTALKHTYKVASSSPQSRKASPLASSPIKISPFRMDEKHIITSGLSRHLHDLAMEEPTSQRIMRKKSGEIVRSVLKLKPSKSEPATPTCPKFVHFDSEPQVRWFLQAETPAAVIEDAFSKDDDDASRGGRFSYTLPNWPSVIEGISRGKTVFVESVSLNPTKTAFTGRVQVENIAFHKRVDIRYTFDFWRTVSEAHAEYRESIIKDVRSPTHDIFVFSIPLEGRIGASEDGSHTMYFAVRYRVDGREFWDNNNDKNYQVEFSMTLPSTSSPLPAKPTPAKTSWNMDDIEKERIKEFGVSPPAFSTSPEIGSMINSKKKLGDRYNIGASLTATRKNASIPSVAAQDSFTNSPPRPSHQRGKSFPSFFSPAPTSAAVPSAALDDDYPASYYSNNYFTPSIEAPLTSSVFPWEERGAIPITIGKSKPPSDKLSPKESMFLSSSPNGPRPSPSSSGFDLNYFYPSSPYSNSPPTLIRLFG